MPLALLAIASFKPSEVAGGLLHAAFTLAHYRAFFDDGVTSAIFLSTVRLAAIVTITCLLARATIPIQIFGSLSYQIEPSIAAISGLTLIVTAALSALLVLRGQFGTKASATV